MINSNKNETKLTRKLLLEFPVEIHTKIKMAAVSKMLTLNDFILSLVTQSLNQEKEQQ
ncbi:MAG: hypothetical protein HQK96_11130 [Nitrospirae bacterium]|nr:hypothetical protein [Nitrospirota bacterium]